jgi:hypothetical protein
MIRHLVACALPVLLVLSTGCSLRTYAVNMVGDALASGESVYESDDDIELVGEALPFGLKLTESLLAQSPNHDARAFCARVPAGFTSGRCATAFALSSGRIAASSNS